MSTIGNVMAKFVFQGYPENRFDIGKKEKWFIGTDAVADRSYGLAAALLVREIRRAVDI